MNTTAPMTLELEDSDNTEASSHHVTSYAEASAIYSAIRDDSYEGASTFPDGKLTTASGEVLKISYNGKIWRGDVLAFDPYMIEQVSEAFRAALARALTPSQLSDIDILNASEPNSIICHSHDFCDANMVMDEAMKACGITPLGEDGMTAETAELWNAAWDHAKAAGFSAPKGSGESKPTPGPLVADFNSTMPNEPRFRVYSKETGGNVGLFYAEADADLFVAASDMLAALKLAESVYRLNVVAPGEPSSVLDAMQSAIAKAEGRANG